MPTDPQSLLSAAGCYDCYGGSPGMQGLLRLALLRQILLAQNPNAMTDPQSLLTQANCYACYANSPGMVALLELGLLAQISSNGGTGLGNNGEVALTGSVIDWSAGSYFYKTIAANTVFTFANNQDTQTIVVAITGDASHTVTWPASVKWSGGSAPVQTLSKTDVYTF